MGQKRIILSYFFLLLTTSLLLEHLFESPTAYLHDCIPQCPIYLF